MAMKDDEQGSCELLIMPPDHQCGRAALLRYPASGGGYMRLCQEHGTKHEKYCQQWMGAGWSKAPALTDK